MLQLKYLTMLHLHPQPPILCCAEHGLRPADVYGGPAGVVAQLRGGRRVMESDPNYVPCARRGTMAVANTVAFFGWMDAFVPW